MKIQLITFPGCPHAEEARMRLSRSLSGLGLSAGFEDVDVTASDTAEHLRRWPSPTILIDGQDLEGAAPAGGPSCRLYPGGGAPGEDLIRAALQRALQGKSRRGPGVGLLLTLAMALGTVGSQACVRRSVPDGSRPLLFLPTDLHPLRDAFNSGVDHPRLIAFLSPT